MLLTRVLRSMGYRPIHFRHGENSGRRGLWPSVEPLEPRVLLSAAVPGTDAAGAAQEPPALFGASPALFVENQGQWQDESVRFVHQGSGLNVAMTDGGPIFQAIRGLEPAAEDGTLAGATEAADSEPASLEMRQFSVSFLDAMRVTPVGLAPAGASFNYFVGDASTWRSDVPGYEAVVYEGLYPGIDLYTFAQGDSLKYEFTVAAASDWTPIRIRYDGISGLSISDQGELVVNVGEGWSPLIDAAPYVYQDIDGRRIEIDSRYVLVDDVTYTFELGAYDSEHALVIDPELIWSAYLGGSASDHATEIAVDDEGDVLVGGPTRSSDFFGVNNAHPQSAMNGFVAKFSPTGVMQWATYFGGSGNDRINGLAVDASGTVHVTGQTHSTDLPGAINTHEGLTHPSTGAMAANAFVARLTPTGELAWSRYLAGSLSAVGFDVAMDGGGNTLVTGLTYSTAFPGTDDTNPSFSTSTPSGFLSSISPSGEVLWSALFGGSFYDEPAAMAVDAQGNSFVIGRTDSVNFTGANNENPSDGVRLHDSTFVVKIAPTGVVQWATYLGGSNQDRGLAIAIDHDGHALVTGLTRSANFGGANNTIPRVGASTSVFVAKLLTTGELAWATYLGGSVDSEGNGIVVDAANHAVIVGVSASGDFRGASNANLGGPGSAFLARVTPQGNQVWASFVSTPQIDIGIDIALNATGRAFIVGTTLSSNFPGANNTYPGEGINGFVASLQLPVGGDPDPDPDPGPDPGPGALVVPLGGELGRRITYLDADGTTVVVRLTGPGSGTLHFAGAGLTVVPVRGGARVNGGNVVLDVIALSDTTLRSALTIQTRGGDKSASVGRIEADTPLGRLNGPGVDLIGEGVVMSGEAFIGRTLLRDLLNGADLLLPGAGAANGIIISLGQMLGGGMLVSGSGIAALSLTHGDSGASVSAPWLGRLNTRLDRARGFAGNFAADLILSGEAAPRNLVLAAAKIAGTLSGDWQVGGSAGPIAAGAIAPLWAANFDGAVRGVSSRSDAGGALTAESIGAFTVRGNLTNAAIHLTAAFDPSPRLKSLNRLTVGGTADGLALRSLNDVGTILVGALVNGLIFIGLDDAQPDLPVAATEFLTQAHLARLMVRGVRGAAGESFANTRIAAPFLDRVLLKDVELDNAGQPLGLVALELGSLTLVQGGQRFTWPNRWITESIDLAVIHLVVVG